MTQLILDVEQQALFSIQEAVNAAEFLKREDSFSFITKTAHYLACCFQRGNKVLVIGNGGSLCDAMHFAEELTGQFRKKRKALPAIALSDPGFLSCVANDFGYAQVFARGVEALGVAGDVLIALTTSGNSPNIVEAIKKAKEKGLGTVAFLGKEGGMLKKEADLEWIVTGFAHSDRIQEAHMAAIHIIIELMEYHLFSHVS